MINARGYALLAALTLGCGDDGSEPTLVGTWGLVGDGPYDCAYVIAFQDDDTYAESVLCQLEGGGLGAEVYGGTYEAQGGEVTLTQTLGTCDVDPLVVAVSYELDGDTLIMGSDEQVKQLKRVDKDSDTPAQVTYGCYAQDGSFTPSPIRDL